MSTDVDRIFDDFDNADPSKAGGGGNKIAVEGRFKVRVDKHLIKVSDKTNQIFFVCEFEVLESSVDEVPVGAKRSWTCDMTRRFGDNMVGRDDVAGHLVACAGGDAATTDVGKEDLQAATGEKQVLKGSEVMLDTVPKVGEKSNRPWTQHRWSAVG